MCKTLFSREARPAQSSGRPLRNVLLKTVDERVSFREAKSWMKNHSNRPRAKGLIWNHRSIMRYHAPYAATIEVSLRAFGPAMAEVGGLHHLAPRLLHLHGEPSNCSIQQFLKGFMECVQTASCDVKDWSLRGFSQLECGCHVESSSPRFF